MIDTTSAKFKDISRQLPTLLLGVSDATRALLDESGMIRTQTGTHNGPQNGRSAWDALYDTTS
jgi:hypothetical protein